MIYMYFFIFFWLSYNVYKNNIGIEPNIFKASWSIEEHQQQSINYTYIYVFLPNLVNKPTSPSSGEKCQTFGQFETSTEINKKKNYSFPEK